MSERHSFQGEDSPPPAADDPFEPRCWKCGSPALGEFETGPVRRSGGTDLYLVCEDCGAEQRRLGAGGGVL